MRDPTDRDRFRGCLLGLAAGDALGTTLEFRPPGSFEPIDDMVGGGPFHLQPGQWTDDTSMALCLATSLAECGGFDPAGNGSLKRLAPVPMYYSSDASEAIAMASNSSRVTHGSTEAVDACRYFAGLLVGALHGVDKQTLLSPGYCPAERLWERNPLAEKIARVASGSFKGSDPPDIRGTGYVVDALEAALWAFDRSDSFHEGALLAVNLGDDADTTGFVHPDSVCPYDPLTAIGATRSECEGCSSIVSSATAFPPQLMTSSTSNPATRRRTSTGV